MSEGKKRAYSSPSRAERAASTRTAILDAAGELFESGGYSRTTTAAIAKKAGVSEAMVFSAFGSKAGVLQALIGRAVAGDGRGEHLARRDEWSEAAASHDPQAAIGGFASLAADIQRRSWRLIDLSRTASDADPAMAELSAQGAANRRADCRAFAERALAGRLREGVTVDDAADLLWTYTSADLYRLLVAGAAWSHTRYATWLRDTLVAALVQPQST